MTEVLEKPELSQDEEIDRLRKELADRDRKLSAAFEANLEVRESRERLRSLETAMERKKKAASDAKKAFETAIEAHLQLEDELDSGQGRLPLSAAPDPKPATAAETEPATATDGPATIKLHAVEDESWRECLVVDLGLPTGIEKALIAAEIDTIGKLADWTAIPTASGYNQKLTDIGGIGAAKAEKIEAAMIEFWAARKTQAETAVVEVGAPTVASIDQELADAVHDAEEEQIAELEAQPPDGDEEIETEEDEDDEE